MPLAAEVAVQEVDSVCLVGLHLKSKVQVQHYLQHDRDPLVVRMKTLSSSEEGAGAAQASPPIGVFETWGLAYMNRVTRRRDFGFLILEMGQSLVGKACTEGYGELGLVRALELDLVPPLTTSFPASELSRM